MLSRKNIYRNIMQRPERCLLLGVLLMLAGCQTQPAMQQIQAENRQLQQQLGVATAEVARLDQANRVLQAELTERERIMAVLDTEKDTRANEASQLRAQIRGFVQQRIDGLKAFLVHSDLLDYIGSELVDRAQSDEQPHTIVDLANPVPRAGSLTAVGGYFNHSDEFTVMVLRPVGSDWVVIWRSQSLLVADQGLQQINLPVSVGVEAGDVLAYRLPAQLVGFDRGTGQSYLVNSRGQKQLATGSILMQKQLAAMQEHRAYSLGVYALLR